MRIETGHPVTNDVEPVKSRTVRFVDDDGRAIFEVRCGDDGRSIEVRGVQCFKHGDVIYSEQLQLHPRSSNAIDIATRVYGA